MEMKGQQQSKSIAPLSRLYSEKPQLKGNAVNRLSAALFFYPYSPLRLLFCLFI